jgi:hypothetical protein
MRSRRARRLRWWVEDNQTLLAVAAVVAAVVLILALSPRPLPIEPAAGLPVSSAYLSVDERPYIITWMIGNARGAVYDTAAVLDLDMTVYPASAGAGTIYPQNIVFSSEKNPQSGYYAVGFEGTLQPNIYYDPVSKKFYHGFLDEPTRASECMVYTPDAGGEQVVQQMIAQQSFMNANANENNTNGTV